MLDDFLVRAVVAGIGIAIVAGPLGCLIIWRRMAFFGDSLAHASLLGVALALAFDLAPAFAVPLVTMLACAILLGFTRQTTFAPDTILSIVAQSTLALGLVLISLIGSYEVSIMGVLLGDILAVSKQDIALIYGGGAIILAVLVRYWRRLVVATISQEIAVAENMSPRQSDAIFMFLIALVVAIALKLVGALLITALLIIPAATARRFSPTPEIMAVIAILIGMTSLTSGIFASLHLDTPTGPTIILAGTICFALSLLIPQRLFRKS